jgi:hypothetical protein
VDDTEAVARLKAACERIRLLGVRGPRPVYDPGAAPTPSLPKPPADAPMPPQPFHDREPGDDE